MDFRSVREDAKTVSTALQARMLVMQLKDPPESAATEALVRIANYWTCDPRFRERDGVHLSTEIVQGIVAEVIQGLIARLRRFPDNLDHLLSDELRGQLRTDVVCEVIAQLGDVRTIPSLIAAATHDTGAYPGPVRTIAKIGGEKALSALSDMANMPSAINSVAIEEVANVAGVSFATKIEVIKKLLSVDVAFDKRRDNASVAALVSMAEQGSLEAKACLAELHHDSRDGIRKAANRGLKRFQTKREARQAFLDDPAAEICTVCLKVGIRPSVSRRALAAILDLLWVFVGIPALVIVCAILLRHAQLEDSVMTKVMLKKVAPLLVVLTAVVAAAKRIHRAFSPRCIHCDWPGHSLVRLATPAGQRCLEDQLKREQGTRA